MYINDNKREISHIFKTLYRGVEYEPVCSGKLIKYNDCNVEARAMYKLCINCYGSLKIKKKSNKYFWSIEDWNSNEWEEIPKYLYNALIKFEKGRK